MVLIAGLGNPEIKYNGTRHNVGFGVIDELAKRHGIDIRQGRLRGLVGTGRIGDVPVCLCKPLTYMNDSGACIRPLADYYRVDTQTQLIVLSDDIELDVGRLRVRPQGSAGGHNGLKSVIAHLGHDRFCRVRVGVGRKPPGYDQVRWVLGHFSEEEIPVMQKSMARAADAVGTILAEGVDAAMNRFNAAQPESTGAAHAHGVEEIRTESGGVI